MTSPAKFKKDKEIIAEYDTQVKEIRAQLVEQLKCLDQQCELRVQLLQDLQDFFRKKAEIEMDYSRNLEKLAERFLAKTRSTKDQQFNALPCWAVLSGQQLRKTRSSSTLGSESFLRSERIHLGPLPPQCSVTFHMHSTKMGCAWGFLSFWHYSHILMLYFHFLMLYFGVFFIFQRQAKYTENRLKAIKARNEYLLALEATNASVFKYYIHDLSDLIDQCCDLGYHASLNRALRTFLSAELNLEQSKHEGLDAIENAVENLDANSDKQRLMEMYNNVFCPPMKFEFQPHMGDMESQLCAQQPVQSELVQRCQQLQSRLSTLKIENEEVKKTMEATLQTIQDIVTIEDFDVSDCFQYSNSMESVKSTVSETFMSKPSIAKRRANQQETEQFYFTVRG
uniref:F-BAR domain-containing protein n=1 Tax=Junco hyemalis TaxID=40217 RepID=A0A8C5JNK2_JUNHY